jgi:hypothetical protein
MATDQNEIMELLGQIAADVAGLKHNEEQRDRSLELIANNLGNLAEATRAILAGMGDEDEDGADRPNHTAQALERLANVFETAVASLQRDIPVSTATMIASALRDDDVTAPDQQRGTA